jgi:hypothetical protein
LAIAHATQASKQEKRRGHLIVILFVWTFYTYDDGMTNFQEDTKKKKQESQNGGIINSCSHLWSGGG